MAKTSLSESVANAVNIATAKPLESKFSKREQGDALNVESVSERIKTIADAIRHGGIDEAIWYVEKSECTSHEGYYKTGPKGEETAKLVLMWNIKITLKRRVTRLAQREFETLFDRMRKHAPKYPALRKARKISDPHMAEFALLDVHFGKLAWRHETGEDCDLDISKRRYLAAFDELKEKISGFPIEEIVLPIGQDLFHVDNRRNETTAGTPQDADGRYSKIWSVGKEAVIEVVERCAAMAPTRVVFSAGNHDEVTSFHMCEYLAAWFRRCNRVTVDAEPKSRKYVTYGPVVIGYTHGNREKLHSLPALMLHEARELMATRRTLEIHHGHFHKVKETVFVNSDTHAGGVRMRCLPSLSGTDRWHYDQGYVGATKAAEVYLWSKESGYSGHFSANVRE
jgi:hypothetical protein